MFYMFAYSKIILFNFHYGTMAFNETTAKSEGEDPGYLMTRLEWTEQGL